MQWPLAPLLAAASLTSVVARRAAAPAKKQISEERVAFLETALLQLFGNGTFDEKPDIFKVREILTELAKVQVKPNSGVAGDWIIYWCSRQGCIDRLLGTGVTDGGTNMWLEMTEYLIRFGNKKEGRIVEAAEVLRKVGPFPNQYNSLKGTYTTAGTTGMQITFTDMRTDEDKPLKFPGGAKKKVVDVDVIYSSKAMVCVQIEESAGEYDFFVLTPVKDWRREVEKLMGAERRRFFFN